MYKITLQLIKRQFVSHIDYTEKHISFNPIKGAVSYKLYAKHFSRDEWQLIDDIAPSGMNIELDEYTEIAIAATFSDGYEQDPRDCIPFAQSKTHMQVVIPNRTGEITSYGSRMLMGMPEVISAKYNDMSNFGFSAHTFGKALSGVKENSNIISLLKKFRPVQDMPDVAYRFYNFDFAGLPYGIRNNIEYTLEDVTSQTIVLPNGIELSDSINMYDFKNIVGDISSTRIVDKFDQYYNINGTEEDVVIYYSPSSATLTLYSSETKDWLGTFTVAYNQVDILEGSMVIGVDVTPNYLYVAYSKDGAINVAIVDKTIPVGSNALTAKKILSTSMPENSIYGMRTYANVFVFQTESGYLTYRKMFNYYYVQDSSLYTFEDYSAVVSAQRTYNYSNYFNVWTDVDDMMQMFGRYRAQGETIGAFYFRTIHELMRPINSTLPAIRSYMYYIADKAPYSTDIQIAPFDEHPFFHDMDNGITSDTLQQIITSNKTVWGLAEWGNAFKTNNDSFASSVFYPRYDNADGTIVNGTSYSTPSGGMFIYTNGSVWYEANDGTVHMQQVKDGDTLAYMPTSFEPIIAANGNVVLLRDVDALSRVITVDTSTSYDYLQIQSTEAITATVSYEATDGQVYKDSGTFDSGMFTLSQRIKPDGYLFVEATDSNGNKIDMYIMRNGNAFAAYDSSSNTIHIYPSDKIATIEYVEA